MKAGRVVKKSPRKTKKRMRRVRIMRKVQILIPAKKGTSMICIPDLDYDREHRKPYECQTPTLDMSLNYSKSQKVEVFLPREKGERFTTNSEEISATGGYVEGLDFSA